MGSSASGGGGGGLTASITPDPLEWYFNGSDYTVSATASVSGGLEPYTIDWFLSPGDATAIFVANGSITLQSYTGADCDLYFEVTDTNGALATSSTLTVTLP